MFADSISVFVEPPFKTATVGSTVAFGDAWIGVLSYALQIYFDFSAYSDMAIGLALMMGITFPLNFNSPYKANSLIDFWRRWHMTLSRFLRDYLYFPLGGNRKGPSSPSYQPPGHYGIGGTLAWCDVEFRRLGRDPRRRASIQSPLAGLLPTIAIHAATLARLGYHPRPGCPRLGPVPRRNARLIAGALEEHARAIRIGLAYHYQSRRGDGVDCVFIRYRSFCAQYPGNFVAWLARVVVRTIALAPQCTLGDRGWLPVRHRRRWHDFQADDLPVFQVLTMPSSRALLVYLVLFTAAGIVAGEAYRLVNWGHDVLGCMLSRDVRNVSGVLHVRPVW